jgi:MOSC domain-containing protein YiiM
LRPEDLRRNVVTRGGVLSELIGASFVVGSTQLLGVRVCDPCRYIERFSREGIFDALAGRGGLRARIIRSGLVRVGDHVGCLRANGGS